MSEEYENPYEGAEEATPEKLAELIFNEPPGEPKSIVILPYTDETISDIASFNFEILISMYMEAVCDTQRLVTILQTKQGIPAEGDTPLINVTNIKKEHLEIPIPWFKSFGYNIRVMEFKMDDVFVDPKDQYCTVLLKTNPSDVGFFFYNKIIKPFHFLKNANYTETNKMENIKAVFKKPRDKNIPGDKETLFVVSFVPL